MEKLNGETFLGQFIKGVITTVAITLVCVLVFALVLSLTDLGDGVIRPVNQFIKLAAVFCGVVISVKGEKGFLKGLAVGLAATVLSFLVFGLIGGGLSFGWAILIDLVCGAVMGGLSGAISVNLPGRN